MLTNKIAIITGGAKGIGKATVDLFIKRGATVIAGDMIFEKGIMKENECVWEKYLNIADQACVNDFFKEVHEKFGRIDILVNNAGIVRNLTPFEEVTRESWDKVMNVNFYGTIYCCNAVIPYMKKQKYGKIINSSSLAGEVGGIRVEASYSASKAGNICNTFALAKYLGPYGINVNCVAPGFIKTDMGDSLDAPDLQTVPLRRLGTAEDVAKSIAFLASDDASYLTGVILDVNGGCHMR